MYALATRTYFISGATLLPIARRTVRFRRPVLHVQVRNRREKTFDRLSCCALRRRMCCVLSRREVYGAMPRSRDPGYVRVPDTIQPYSIIAAGATSPEPSEARKAAMLWFLTFSMVDGMMPYVGLVSTPALQFSACQTSKSVADKWSLAELLVEYTPRRRAVRRSGGGACKCALVGSARCMAGGVGGGHVEVAGRTSPRLCWLARASSVQTASGPSASSFASASATACPASLRRVECSNASVSGSLVSHASWLVVDAPLELAAGRLDHAARQAAAASLILGWRTIKAPDGHGARR